MEAVSIKAAPIYQGNTTAVTGVALRDSKDPSGPILVFTPGEWTAFLEQARLGNLEVSKLVPWGETSAVTSLVAAPAVISPKARTPQQVPKGARSTYQGFRAPSSPERG